MFLTIKNLFSIRFNFFKGPEDILKLNLLRSLAVREFTCIPNIQTRVVHLDVEEWSEELLTPALLCHKEPAQASKAPY